MANNVERISEESDPMIIFPQPEQQKTSAKPPPPQITIPPPLEFDRSNSERLTTQFAELAIRNAKQSSSSSSDKPIRKRGSSLSLLSNKKKTVVPNKADAEKAIENSYHSSRSASLQKCFSIGKLSVITRPLIEEMLPADRMTLKINLEKLTHLETPIPANTEPPAEYTRAIRGLKVINEFQKEIRDQQLLQIIITNQENFWQKFFIAGESIISFTDLFSIILPHVQLPEKKESPRTNIQFFLLFCSNWLHANRGTGSVKTVRDQINQIIAATANHSESSIKKQSERLKKDLDSALQEHPCCGNIIAFNKSEILDFKSFLKQNIYNPAIYKKMVTVTAKDLFYRQIELYTHITEFDFFKKKDNTRLTAIDISTNHSNCLSSYMTDTILKEKDFQKRVLLIKFFIDVGKECLSLKDFASASAIGTPFFTGPFNRIPNTWKAVRSSEIHGIMLDRFKEIFWGLGNFKVLRSYLDEYKQEPHIPYLGITLKDVIQFSEISSLSHSENADPTYNLHKMSSIALCIQNYLAAKEKFKRPEYMKLLYSTSFIPKVLYKHKPISDDDRYDLAEKLPDLPN